LPIESCGNLFFFAVPTSQRGHFFYFEFLHIYYYYVSYYCVLPRVPSTSGLWKSVGVLILRIPIWVRPVFVVLIVNIFHIGLCLLGFCKIGHAAVAVKKGVGNYVAAARGVADDRAAIVEAARSALTSAEGAKIGEGVAGLALGAESSNTHRSGRQADKCQRRDSRFGKFVGSSRIFLIACDVKPSLGQSD
jgi:hypothetical protein